MPRNRFLYLNDTVELVVKDEDGNVADTFILPLITTSGLQKTVDRPMIQGLPNGESMNLKVVQSFDEVWGILALANVDGVKFQIYDGNDDPQFPGAIGREFTLLGAFRTSTYVQPLFTKEADSDYYLKVVNQNPSSLDADLTVIVLGRYNQV